jgi:hypothetical protein
VPLLALLSLSSFLFLPKHLGSLYVFLLPLFGAAAKQYDDLITIPAKINAVTGSEIDPVFQHTLTDALCIRKVTLFHSNQSCHNPGSRRRIQAVKPFGVWIPTFSVDVLLDCDHWLNGNT